jgi:hypothetical protein
MNKYIKRAIDNFYNRNFEQSLLNFSLALKEDENSSEARIGAMLSDLAMEKEEEAIALFEYYTLSKESGIKNLEDLIEEIISSLEFNIEEISELFLRHEIETKIDEENGIAYDDFRKIVADKNDFKEAFEDIMFSTKVIIQNKEDFLDFLEELIKNGYTDISMNYFESAVGMFPNDQRLLSLIKKAQE